MADQFNQEKLREDIAKLLFQFVDSICAWEPLPTERPAFYNLADQIAKEIEEYIKPQVIEISPILIEP